MKEGMKRKLNLYKFISIYNMFRLYILRQVLCVLVFTYENNITS